MLYMRRLTRVILVLCLTGSISGCGQKPDIGESVVEESNGIYAKFDDVIPSICLENNGPDVEEQLNKLDVALSAEEVPIPYTVFDSRFGGESQLVTFDVLDSDNKLLHVSLKGTKTGYIVECVRDTPEEVKRQITDVLQKMLGETVSIRIDDTYKDYVRVYAQGKEFRWKDGHLERVP